MQQKAALGQCVRPQKDSENGSVIFVLRAYRYQFRSRNFFQKGCRIFVKELKEINHGDSRRLCSAQESNSETLKP